MSLPLQAESYSPPKTFSLKPVARRGTETFAPVRFVLLDTTNDGRRNYDRVAILNDRGGLAASARAGEWFSLAETPGERDGEKDVLAGRWGKVLALTPDLSAVSVYLGGLHVTRANPEDFRKTLDRRAGFWPGSPDPVLLAGKRPDNRTFLEQAERFTDFLITAFEVARRRGDWDLLLAYQPLLDQGGHAFSWTDPRHPGYTEDLAARGSLAMQRLWRAADRAAAAYLRFARDGDGDVFLVSDHGIRPVYRSVRIHELLQRGGFLQPNGTGVTAHVNAQATQHAQAPPAGKPAHDASASPRVAAVAGVATADPASTMDAFARGGAACILVNRAGVYPGGNVEKESADPLVEAMARYLRDLRDDAGDRVFTTVATRAELPALRLDHENAGDLFLIAAPGTSIRTGFAPPGDSSIFAEPENPGEHGYEPDPKLDALFLHVGEGIARESVPTIAVTDVARLVSLRLGIDPPSGNAPAAREATAAP